MSDDPRSGAGEGDLEPRVSQRAFATGNSRVMQAARDQYILNLGNILWVAVPVLVAVAGLFLYAAVRPVNASSPPRETGPSASSVSRSASGAPSQSAPLAVALSYDKNNVDNGAGPCMVWVFKQPLSALSPPQAWKGTDETWAHRNGGIDARVTNFKLAVQGLTPNEVDLTGLRVIDLKRAPLVTGTNVISTDGCGPMTEAGFSIALGKNPPTVTKAAVLDGPAKAIAFPFEVSSTDIQQFQITAAFSDYFSGRIATCNCVIKWRLALDWSYEGRTGSTVIDDNGQPFQTLFPPENPASSPVTWYANNGAWSRAI